MEIKDLRIGNLVKTVDGVFLVSSISSDKVFLNTVFGPEPFEDYEINIVVLEPNNLRRLGFEIDNVSSNSLLAVAKYTEKLSEDVEVICKYNIWSNNETSLEITLKYKDRIPETFFKRNVFSVHQLQNAYFLLTGKEFNIEKFFIEED